MSVNLQGEQKGLFRRIAAAWLKLALPLALVAGFYAFRVKNWGPEEVFFWRQDLPVLLGMTLVLIAFPWLPPWGRRIELGASYRSISVLALGAFLISGAGAWLVFEGYTLSLDEYLADFDAEIFRRGYLMAHTPEDWRPFVRGLQPIYMLETPAHEFWASSYLPLNAAFRALGGLIGAQAWVNPFWAAVSVVTIFAVSLRLWPDRPGLAIGAAVLLATSAQFLITAMTAYAMSAHLALNLIWLALFLRRRALSDAGAIGVGFVACGLHQVIFHPLFVAPFIIEMLIARAWRRAAVFIAAYAVIGLFWIAYWALLYRWLGIPSGQAEAVGGTWFVARVVELLAVDIQSVNLMAESLVRYVTWQSLLLTPLAVIGGGMAFRAGGTPRALTLGILLTILAMLVLVPSQTHGWGYRYLHGLLGSACLLAMFAWGRMTANLSADSRARTSHLFALAGLLSAVVLVPLRATQAYGFSHPFARADAVIRNSAAEVVLVDNGTVGFDMGSLVRNDPFLERKPKVMLLNAFAESGLTRICSQHSVWVFDATHPSAKGFQTFQAPWRSRTLELRAHLKSIGCGEG